jgi:hypothetical protein
VIVIKRIFSNIEKEKIIFEIEKLKLEKQKLNMEKNKLALEIWQLKYEMSSQFGFRLDIFYFQQSRIVTFKHIRP